MASQHRRQGRPPSIRPRASRLPLLLLLLLPRAALAFFPSRLWRLQPRAQPPPTAHQTRPTALKTAAATVPASFDSPRNGTEGGGCPFHGAAAGSNEAGGGGTSRPPAPYAPGPFRWPLVGNMVAALLYYKGIDKFDWAMMGTLLWLC